MVISPYAGKNPAEVKVHVDYANRCMLDCLYAHGEAPFATHVLYTKMLDDQDPQQRALGLQAGDEWAKLATRLVVYTDYGFSDGMNETINKSGKPCVHRSIGPNPSGQPNEGK